MRRFFAFLHAKYIKISNTRRSQNFIGISIYSSASDDFIFKLGAVFCNILLADELRLLTGDNVLDDASMLGSIFEKKELLQIMDEVKEVFIDKSLSRYIPKVSVVKRDE